ncbi:hypothetical protein TKK_0007973 [Trichogramma kaykai]
MDIVGPLPLTVSGNKYILTLQCNLTKYSEAIPLPDVKADMIASAFSNEFVFRFGCPQTLRTDMGQNLIGKVFSTLAKLFKIRQIHSTAYRPKPKARWSGATTVSSSTSKCTSTTATGTPGSVMRYSRTTLRFTPLTDSLLTS